MLQTGEISDIPKTIIFVDKIEDEIKIAQYLQLLLPESPRKKGDQIIRTFLSNREPSRQEFFVEKFENGNTCILICTDAAGMEVNIQDVARTIQ